MPFVPSGRMLQEVFNPDGIFVFPVCLEKSLCLKQHALRDTIARLAVPARVLVPGRVEPDAVALVGVAPRAVKDDIVTSYSHIANRICLSTRVKKPFVRAGGLREYGYKPPNGNVIAPCHADCRALYF